ncbi:MAG: LamG domain-containing protein, partial [Verrucomicrobiae bacterium]|nr:LamG domain-containing protein [Verrucomicrobiae bacterium]
MKGIGIFLSLLMWLVTSVSGQEPGSASRWWEPYEGKEAAGPFVLGFWRFDEESAVGKDSSSHGLEGNLRGATWSAGGRFGEGCLRGGPGYPVIDDPHGFVVKRSPILSPGGAFSLEMWLHPDSSEERFPPEVSPVLADCKYVPDNHTGFIWTLTRQSKSGARHLQLEIGLGARSERWFSDPLELTPEKWHHLAFTYDGTGTVAFYLDGEEIGRSTRTGAGSMAAAIRDLSLGDRIGSLYHGFPGQIDEIRFSEGVREFRPVRVSTEAERPAFLRLSEGA